MRDNLFKNKQLPKINKIMKVLIGYEQKHRADKKFAQNVFNDKMNFVNFMRSNVQWVLDKCGYDFTKDDLQYFKIMIKNTAKTIVRNNQETTKNELDQKLQTFLEKQNAKYPELRLTEELNDTFKNQQPKPIYSKPQPAQ